MHHLRRMTTALLLLATLNVCTMLFAMHAMHLERQHFRAHRLDRLSHNSISCDLGFKDSRQKGILWVHAPKRPAPRKPKVKWPDLLHARWQSFSQCSLEKHFYARIFISLVRALTRALPQNKCRRKTSARLFPSVHSNMPFFLGFDVQSIYCVNSLRTSFSFSIFLYRFQYRPIIFLFFSFSFIFVPLGLFDRCARSHTHRENFLHDVIFFRWVCRRYFLIWSQVEYVLSFVIELRSHKTMDVHRAPSTEHTENNCLM